MLLERLAIEDLGENVGNHVVRARVLTALCLSFVSVGGCSGRILGGETVTGFRVGHTGARITLADASYHKIRSTWFGAGYRVGIQNAPAGAPLTDHRSVGAAFTRSFSGKWLFLAYIVVTGDFHFG
jgi:hypothetical protein